MSDSPSAQRARPGSHITSQSGGRERVASPCLIAEKYDSGVAPYELT